MQKQRPKYLDVGKIRLPVPGIVSILHRISGVLMFIALPFLIYLLHGSLNSAGAFNGYRAVIAEPFVKIVLIILLWAFLHHALAGIRFLFMDAHKGVELSCARASAKTVLLVSVVLTVILGGALW